MIYPMASRRSNEIIEPRINLEDVPLKALSLKTRSKLSILLNPEKVLKNEDGYFRDWRGIFEFSGLSQSDYAIISQTDDKFSKLLEIWIRYNSENNKSVSLSQLQQCLGLIDRYDICDDLMTLFNDDALAYQRHETQPVLQELPIEQENSNIITTIDKEHYQDGLPLPVYDALVIYSDKDADFTADLVKRMREKNYLLCLKDDLLPGLPFEFDSLLTILSKRCNRLIVIISKEFLESKMHIFITNYAQTLGIEQGKRKIIPCVLEPCDLPQMLRFCYRLDYYRNNKLFDFWDKLDKSLQLSVVEGKRSVVTKSIEPSAPQQDIVYKFSETPATPEKIKKSSFSQEEEPKRQIMPPPRRLRTASSMIGLDSTAAVNGTLSESSRLSHSSLNISQQVTESTSLDSSIKLKRKKWYSVFLPPHKDKEKSAENELVTEKKEKKRKWYKSKKKEKIAVQL